ncbi:hypothetical protein D9D79_23245 [Escherichia coli]|nr:hypothetical protein [Escherichia coli]
MAVKISGVLKDGTGKPVQNCTIQLKAKRNSTTVVVNTVASENPDEAGRYSMDVEYGQYSVILLVEGLSQEQDGIKSHTHSASASSTDLGTKTTSSFDYGTKSTNNTGAHTHSLSGSTNAAGNHSHRDGRRFNPSVFKDTYQYGYTSSGQNTWGVQGSVGMSTGWLANTSTDGNHSHSLSGTAASAGAHAHTVGIGAHTHSVAIGSHGHTITVNAAGNAENTVKNIAFNYIVRLA